MTGRLKLLALGLGFVSAIGVSTPLMASETIYETVNYTKATHEEMVEDLRVKVLGGYLPVRRYYRVVKQRVADAEGNILYAGVSGATSGFSGNTLLGSAGSSFRSSSRTVSGSSSGSGSGGSSNSGGSVELGSEQTIASYGVWQFHRKWHDLVFLDRDLSLVSSTLETSISSGGGSGGTSINGNATDITTNTPQTVDTSGAKYIDRNDFVYVKKRGTNYFEYQHNGADLRITETETGYRWSNRKGDWIDYDEDGKALASGDKNNVTITLVRDSNGFIRQYKDHLDRVVLTYTYAGNKPIKVEDYTGRQVNYEWSGNSLTKVTTSRGHDWTYGYETIGSNNHVLTSKTDPEGQTFQYKYQMSGGGFQNITRSNPDVTIIGDSSVSISGGGGGGGSSSYVGGSVPVPSMLMHTEKVYPDGKRIRYQYYYDQDSKTYTLIESNSDGFERERWFDLDGQTQQELRGGLLAGKRIRNGRTAVATDPYGNRTTVNYDEWEAITSVRYADGSSKQFEYLPNYNFPAMEVDELGVQTKHEYDQNGNRIKTTMGFGSDNERVLEYVYDDYGQVTLERYLARTNPDGSSSETVEMHYEYDVSGNIIKQIDGNGNEVLYQGYNAIGQYQTMIDGRGKIWRYTYDNHGKKLTETSPLGFVTRFEYDDIHRLTKVTDAEGRTTSHKYDSRNNLTKTIDNLGGVRSMSYRMDGLILADTDESNQVTRYRYDRATRLIEVTDGVGQETTMVYARGDELAGTLIESVTTPNNKIAYQYDSRNRAIVQSVQSALGKDDGLISSTRTQYSKRSERQAVTDANGNITQYIYNVHGELQSSTNAENENVSYDYDNRGNLVRVTDGLGQSTYYNFDKNNNKISETRPAQTVGSIIERQTYSYDAGDNLIRIIDYNGNVAIYSIDDDGRVDQQSNTSASQAVKDGSQADRVVTYTYDKTDLPKSYADQFSSASYQYDGLGRLTEQNTQFVAQIGSTATNIGKTLQTTYHANSQVKAKTDAEGNLRSYLYDGAGKLTQLSIENVGSIIVNDYEGNLPKTITYPGGTNRNYEYDGLARLKRILVNDNANNLKMNYGYQFDSVGNITQKSQQLGSTPTKDFTYSYDNVYRLTQANQPNAFGDQRYSFDENSNRLSRTVTIGSEETSYEYGYNTQQELTSIQKTLGSLIINNTLEYDNNGTLTKNTDSSIAPNSAENLSFNYNSFGRVQSIKKGETTSLELGSYQYDPQGRRISKTVNGETIYFLYDDTGEGLIAEYNETGELIRGYVYQANGMFTTDPVALKTPKATVGGETSTATEYEYSFYQNDHLGTPQMLVQTSGETVWQAEYDVFGNINETVTLIEQPLRFAGQYHDRETDLYYNWNRFYSPELGRYVTSDPIGLGGGLNTFGYVYGNPVKFFDPTGKIVPAIAACAAIPGCAVTVATIGAATVALVTQAIIDDEDTYLPPREWPKEEMEKDWDIVQQDIDHHNYHKTCEKRPPDGLSPCEKAKWKNRQQRSCQRKRQEWEDRWGRPDTKEIHERALEQVKKALKNSANDIARFCNNNEPLLGNNFTNLFENTCA